MLLPWLALLCLSLHVLAAKDSAREQLVQLASKNNGVVRLDEKTYDLLTSPDRDWSAAVHLTALDKRRRCNPCREFDPSWNAVAKAWSTVPRSERDNHFFATLDFDEAPTVFQKLGLASAPVVYVYPAAEGPRRPASGKLAPYKYDFSHGFDAEPLASELSRHTPVPIPYKAPVDWAKWGTFAVILVSGIITLRFISPVLQSRWTWAIGTILTSLVMQSGYMFTRIRGMPYTAGNGQWIAPGFQNQYGQETQVVAMIYGLLAISFLMLTVVAPLQKSPQRQRMQIYLWTAVNLIIFSVLVSLFRTKNRGYPFKLFL
ncbi:oligosaccharyl transferase subunit OST3/OST6 family [Heliocybe sulcata]|uniref:Oligosaccharyl transferase subunit OST3/OST6 family n=1 Tax=Heliocybe sulcata TaxID=5364 RepID=A0A5C3NDB1_9AGAM|nr:oligosaccharyl transferase subunit OST3/OST6 family [Heliocybe sulcata]